MAETPRDELVRGRKFAEAIAGGICSTEGHDEEDLGEMDEDIHGTVHRWRCKRCGQIREERKESEWKESEE